MSTTRSSNHSTTLTTRRSDTSRDRMRRALSSPTAARITVGVGLILLWEVVVRSAAPAYVAKPSTILGALFQVTADPQFLSAAVATFGAVLIGLSAALILGTVIGVAMGRSPVINGMLKLYVNGLFAMPMIAVLPLITLWFGYTEDARLAIIIYAAFFPIALSALDGARSVPTRYIEAARAYLAKPWHIWFGVSLPASVPYLIAGIRLAAGRALVGAVVAEFFTSINGLGFFIRFNSQTFKHDEAFVAVIFLAAFALAIEWLTNWVTRRYMPWFRRANG